MDVEPITFSSQQIIEYEHMYSNLHETLMLVEH